jgi:hypothetical protein
MDGELDVLGEVLLEIIEVFLLFGEKLGNAQNNVLLDEFDDSVLLRHLSRYVEL